MGLPLLSRGGGVKRAVAAADAGEQAGGLAAKTERLLADLLQRADREEEGSWARGWARAVSRTWAAAPAADAEGRKETSPLEGILDVAVGTLNSVLKAHMQEGSLPRHPPWRRVGADAGHSDGGQLGQRGVDGPVGHDFADCLALLQLTSEVCNAVRPLVAAEETWAAEVSHGELVDWQVLSDLVLVCLEKGWAQGVGQLASWPINGRDDAADAHAGRSWAPDFAAVALLLHQVRSLFKQVSGEAGVAVQEERLAARLCQMQTRLVSDAVSRLVDAHAAFSESVETGNDDSASSSSAARDPSAAETTPGAQKRGELARRHRLLHAVIGCERAVSSCRELLKLLALSLEYRLDNHALLPALRALRADGYVRLLPSASERGSTLAEPATGLVLASWGLVHSGTSLRLEIEVQRERKGQRDKGTEGRVSGRRCARTPYARIWMTCMMQSYRQMTTSKRGSG